MTCELRNAHHARTGYVHSKHNSKRIGTNALVRNLFSRLLKKPSSSFESSSFETGLTAVLRMRRSNNDLMVRRRDSAVSNHGATHVANTARAGKGCLIARAVTVLALLFLLLSPQQASAQNVAKWLCDAAGEPTDVASEWCRDVGSSGGAISDPEPFRPYTYFLEVENPQDTVFITELFPPLFNYDSVQCWEVDGNGTAGDFSNDTATPIDAADITSAPPAPRGATRLDPNDAVILEISSISQTDSDDRLICLVKGFFDMPDLQGTNLTNYARLPGSATEDTNVDEKSDRIWLTQWNSAVETTEPEIHIVKSIVDPAPGNPIDISSGAAIVRYRIEITADADVYFSDQMSITDSLAIPSGLAGVPLYVEYVAGSAECVAPSPTACFGLEMEPEVLGATPELITSDTPIPYLRWATPDGEFGLIEAGETYAIQFDLEVDSTCKAFLWSADGNGLTNSAVIGARDGGDQYTSELTTQDDRHTIDTVVETGAVDVDPDYCSEPPPPSLKFPAGPIKVEKKQITPSGPSPWGTTPGSGIVLYEITITNDQTVVIPPHQDPTTYDNVGPINITDSVRELDGIPPFWAQVVSVGCQSADPSLCSGTLVPGGPHEFFGYNDSKDIWSGSIDQLSPGESVTLTLEIRYYDPACESSPGFGPHEIRNTARISYSKEIQVIDEFDQIPTNPPHSQNVVDAFGQPITHTYNAASSQDTEMDTLPECALKSWKTQDPSTFTYGPSGGDPHDANTAFDWGPPVDYTITFANLGDEPVNVGSLFDALRLDQPNYAVALDFDYEFTCESDPTGPAITNFKPNGSGQIALRHRTKPLTDARIDFIDDANEWAVFPPDAALRCDVTAKVRRPPENNPFCMSQEQPTFSNMALIDVSRFYPSRLPWNPGATSPDVPAPSRPATQPYTDEENLSNWIQGPANNLPRCHNFLVNKTAEPSYISVASAGAGASITYRVSVTDQSDQVGPVSTGWGDTTSSGVDGLIFVDHFFSTWPAGTPPVQPDLHVPPSLTPGATTPPSPDPCAGAQCDWVFGQFPGQDPSYMDIYEFPPTAPNARPEISYEYTVPGPFTPDVIVNQAIASIGLGSDDNWYPRTIERANSISTVVIGSAIEIAKEIDHGDNPIVLASDLAFPVTVNCERPTVGDDGTVQMLTQSVEATLSADTPTVVEGIYVNSFCTIEEDLTTVPLPAGCTWLEPAITYPDVGPAGEGYVHTVASIHPHQAAVTNSYTCPPPVNVSIVKSASDYSVTAGDAVAFTLTVRNDGDVPIESPTIVTVTDALPNGLSLVSAQSNGDWDCSAFPDCTYVGNNFGGIWDPQETALPILVVAQTSVPGVYENCAVVDVQEAPMGQSNGLRSCVTVVVTEKEDCCCEETERDCAFMIPWLGGDLEELCVTWDFIEMMCCILTLVLLFLILLAVLSLSPGYQWLIFGIGILLIILIALLLFWLF